MEAIEKVSAEIEKVITKFGAINEHSSKLIVRKITIDFPIFFFCNFLNLFIMIITAK